MDLNIELKNYGKKGRMYDKEYYKKWYEKNKKTNLFGKKNITRTIKNMCLKCIRFGHKRMWIKAVPYGVSMVGRAGSRILTSIKNIVSGKNSKNVWAFARLTYN